MEIRMHRNQSVDVHKFSMIPRADIARSTFLREFTHKTTFDENWLIPIYLDEVLPGDTFSLQMTGFARLTTPLLPIMDNMFLDTFFFFVPNRLVWQHWVNFQGEQNNPADSISYTIPQVVSPANGWAAFTLADYFGLPTAGQILAANTVSTSALPFRAYGLIWDDWFRDENLQNAAYNGLAGNNGDGPDANNAAWMSLQKRGKKHDYFTSCLPWTQKGSAGPVSLPLTGNATVKTSASDLYTGANNPLRWIDTTSTHPNVTNAPLTMDNTGKTQWTSTAAAGTTQNQLYPSNLYADLSTATTTTINALRLAFQTQRLLERDARGGTRYTEIIRAHFGVISPDARLQRPEYLGGGTQPINISPIPQTSATGLTGGTTPQGNLSAYGTVLAHGHGFTQSFTEHGHIIGLCNIRADINYQQGCRKLWLRNTRYDFFMPVFSELGEQPVQQQEIYQVGTPANDTTIFGYQERWGEYRYFPSLVTGAFRSTYATPLDAWHLAEKFTAAPTLSATFIQQNTPIARVAAAPVPNTHFMGDFFFRVKTTRPMPLYSVPGHMDHF